MKLSIAIISSLAALACAAPAPIAESKTPARANLALQARMNRHARLMNKRKGGNQGFGGQGGGDNSDGSHRQGKQSASATGAGAAATSTVAVAVATGNAATSAAAAASATSTATVKQSTSADDEYNENWAGVVVQGDEGSITGVVGTFVLPTVELPTTGDQVDATYHTASTWIGIDGYSCGTGLWQAGVDGTIDESGTVSWYAWYEWYPADTVAIDLGDLATGDSITVNVTASSTTEGTVTMYNAASGTTFTKTVTSTDELCLADAEWIEEDLVVDDATTEGLANFGSVTFTDAIATTTTGTLSPGDNPIFMDVEDDDNTPLTSSSSQGNTVTITSL